MSWTNIEELPPRPLMSALVRGFGRRCPACGKGRLFQGYSRVNAACNSCGEELHHHRADDLPPYLTIMLVGHIIVPAVLMLEQYREPPVWVHYALWLPLVSILCLWFLPRLKGATIGLQWANRMHGFGGAADRALEP